MIQKLYFTVNEEHLELIREFRVGWCDDEFGAPQIDPKRPYGDSSVLLNIHEILTGEDVGMVGSKRDELTEEEEEKYNKLHRETETVLQIIFKTGKFEAGSYCCEEYERDWVKL